VEVWAWIESIHLRVSDEKSQEETLHNEMALMKVMHLVDDLN
jgi:hypothetical protein